MNCKNTYNHPLSRVRVRAHLQEFYHFCCHKCHSILIKHSISTYCPFLKIYFNRWQILQLQKTRQKHQKIVLCSIVTLHFFSIIPPKCDTCDSKKTTSLLECAYVRVRERCNHFSPVALPLYTLSSSPRLVLTLVCLHRTVHRLILQYPHNISDSLQRKKCSFLQFFHSFGLYRPIYI